MKGRPTFVSRRQLADYFGVTRCTIIAWEKLGLPRYPPLLPQGARKKGANVVRYDLDEAIEWFKNKA